ncbi:hypothetical protein [Pseudomonas sp. IPO3774]|uniref:hypothetical protein n=1 Tax=Pseudomonas sp. IPO3774 TaxID=2738826 RepID=UPI0015A3E8F9|nr:hypothetical protein [Pseudomonas sp. IPO3774]NWD60004.1 hypothetical protein [Pseudomonas sp. IPO3774]
MKIWACAKNSNGFINREDGRYKLFFIWQALKLKRENYHFYESLSFYSTHAREHKRKPMVAVKNGWFRYKNLDKPSGGSTSSDGESISHAFVIAALSQLETISFVFGNQVVPFKFTRLVADEAELRFGNGRTYYPDLYGEFTEDNPFYKKWGGKVAIEVWVEHQCERPKIDDFEAHCVPIIEVKVGPGLRVEQHIRQDDLEGSLERRFAKTKELLSEKVYAKIVSDPVSTKFHREFAADQAEKLKATEANRQRDCALLYQKITAKDEELKATHSRLVKAHSLWQNSSDQFNKLKGQSIDLKAALDGKELELQQAHNQLVAEKKKGFWHWMKGRFSRN